MQIKLFKLGHVMQVGAEEWKMNIAEWEGDKRKFQIS
jgi:hypothetical protein